jgi:hypothetical protein
LPHFANDYMRRQPHTMGLFDGPARKTYLLRLKNPDVLAELEPGQSEAWRRAGMGVLRE